VFVTLPQRAGRGRKTCRDTKGLCATERRCLAHRCVPALLLGVHPRGGVCDPQWGRGCCSSPPGSWVAHGWPLLSPPCFGATCLPVLLAQWPVQTAWVDAVSGAPVARLAPSTSTYPADLYVKHKTAVAPGPTLCISLAWWFH
jgi:hypothetical protein